MHDTTSSSVIALSGVAGGFQQDPQYAPKVETGAYSTGRMQGFGNPNFPVKPESETAAGKLGAIPQKMRQTSVSRPT